MEKLIKGLKKNGDIVDLKAEKAREAYCGSQGSCQRC